MEPKRPADERHGGFFNLDNDPKRVELARPHSLFRTTEWGGLTLVSLLVSWAFPPYFIQVMFLAFLNAGGLLWVTHLGEVGRRRLRDFEAEFAVGHALEEAGSPKAAMEHYQALIPHYSDMPKIIRIAESRIEYLKSRLPKATRARAKRAKPKRGR